MWTLCTILRKHYLKGVVRLVLYWLSIFYTLRLLRVIHIVLRRYDSYQFWYLMRARLKGLFPNTTYEKRKFSLIRTQRCTYTHTRAHTHTHTHTHTRAHILFCDQVRGSPSKVKTAWKLYIFCQHWLIPLGINLQTMIDFFESHTRVCSLQNP